jgi:hypothetical protein
MFLDDLLLQNGLNKTGQSKNQQASALHEGWINAWWVAGDAFEQPSNYTHTMAKTLDFGGFVKPSALLQ